jgi:hypothetical protein
MRFLRSAAAGRRQVPEASFKLSIEGKTTVVQVCERIHNVKLNVRAAELNTPEIALLLNEVTKIVLNQITHVH